MASKRVFPPLGALILFIFWTVAALAAPTTALAAPSAPKTLRVGYYGGTFDPPTLGHRDLVLRAIKAAHLDLLYVIPSLTAPKKPNALPYTLRKKMVLLTFADQPDVRTADSQIENAFREDRATGALKVLRKRHPGAQLLKLSGDDVVSRNFNEELQADPLLRDVGFIIGERSGANEDLSEDLQKFQFGNREVVMIPRQTDKGISSSQVRELLRRSIVPDAAIPVHPDVLRFIRAHGLYKAAPASSCDDLFKRKAG